MRIHIIGGPGSGKSVAASALAKVYHVEPTDLDQLFWDRSAAEYGVKVRSADRDQTLARVLERPSWIIEGVYYSWVESSLQAADVILIMTVPPWRRDCRIVSRFVRRRLGFEASKRESLSDLWRLLAWNHAYDRNNLTFARETLRRLGRGAVECRNSGDVLKSVQSLKEHPDHS
jgi:adenylate kinase family enzyme